MIVKWDTKNFQVSDLHLSDLSDPRNTLGLNIVQRGWVKGNQRLPHLKDSASLLIILCISTMAQNTNYPNPYFSLINISTRQLWVIWWEIQSVPTSSYRSMTILIKEARILLGTVSLLQSLNSRWDPCSREVGSRSVSIGCYRQRNLWSTCSKWSSHVEKFVSV